jgi:hypothetical protein
VFCWLYFILFYSFHCTDLSPLWWNSFMVLDLFCGYCKLGLFLGLVFTLFTIVTKIGILYWISWVTPEIFLRMLIRVCHRQNLCVSFYKLLESILWLPLYFISYWLLNLYVAQLLRLGPPTTIITESESRSSSLDNIYISMRSLYL